MPTLREVVRSLFGAYRLALMDPTGLDYFERGSPAAFRSFFAALIVLPGYAVLMAMRLGNEEFSAPWPTVILVEALAYVISWTAYALVMDDLSRFLERGNRYPLFLTAYNWTSVLQMGLYLPAAIIAEGGLLPSALSDTLVFTTTLAILTYQWFVAQITLELSGFTAAGLVMLDLVLSVFISGAADGLL